MFWIIVLSVFLVFTIIYLLGPRPNLKLSLPHVEIPENIDKYLAEEAVDPLMHVVRNAIDHE